MDAVPAGRTLGRGAVVLGMHRSGTSATTRLIAELGFRLPADSALVEANEGNPRGHFEPRPLVAANDRLLSAGDGMCMAPAPRDVVLAADARSFLDDVMAVGSVVSSAEPWLLKDPRLSLTLPLWMPHLSVDCRFVLCVRHPDEVADSLEQRDRMPRAIGLALWERHLVDALQALAGRATFVSWIDDLADDEPVVRARLAAFLRPLDPSAPASADASLFEPALRHHRRADASADLLPSQEKLVALLTELAGPHDALPAVAVSTSAWADALLEAERQRRCAEREARQLRRRMRQTGIKHRVARLAPVRSILARRRAPSSSGGVGPAAPRASERETPR